MTDREFFSGFVYGEENRANIHILRKFVDGNHESSEPILLVGSCGIGKTHLLKTMYERACCIYPTGILYQTGEDFVAVILQRIYEKDERYLINYFKLHMLLIDDLSSLYGKHSTQQEVEFFIRSMKERGIPVVCTIPEGDIAIEPIVTRFPGSVLQLNSPSGDTVRRLIEQKAYQYNVSNLNSKTIRTMVASKGNGFLIEGALKRCAFQHMFASICN